MSKEALLNDCGKPYERSWPERMLEHHTCFLEGQLLTIIDAVISNVQNKATKDLIRNSLSEFRGRNWKMFKAMRTREIKLPMEPLQNLTGDEI